MTKLAHEIATIMIDEYGSDIFLQRLSDPYWFQALGCVLGYDWHSSGVTTVLTGVLKSALNPDEHGPAVCGSKGRASLRAPVEIGQAGEKLGFSAGRIERLRYASRMSAKIDNAAIQAGYPLYHHAFIVAEDGKWAEVQQGINVKDRTARRYHWLGEHVQNFVLEPHDAIVGDTKRGIALNMTAQQSQNCQKISTDIAKEEPKRVMRQLQSIHPAHQLSLRKWMPEAKWKEYVVDVLYLPNNLNWKALKRAYDYQPQNYEELLGIKGIGPATVRGLALVSELIHGEAPSWKDPVKYSFAYGGKDGVPYPVNRKAMDQSVQILESAIQNAKIEHKEKLRSLQRLRKCVPPDHSS